MGGLAGSSPVARDGQIRIAITTRTSKYESARNRNLVSSRAIVARRLLTSRLLSELRTTREPEEQHLLERVS